MPVASNLLTSSSFRPVVASRRRESSCVKLLIVMSEKDGCKTAEELVVGITGSGSIRSVLVLASHVRTRRRGCTYHPNQKAPEPTRAVHINIMMAKSFHTIIALSPALSGSIAASVRLRLTSPRPHSTAFLCRATWLRIGPDLACRGIQHNP